MICQKCKLTRVQGQPDPCIGMLPGVSFACCGHGGDGYIQFENGKTIRFNNAEIDNVTQEAIPIDPGLIYEMDEFGNVTPTGEKVTYADLDVIFGTDEELRAQISQP